MTRVNWKFKSNSRSIKRLKLDFVCNLHNYNQKSVEMKKKRKIVFQLYFDDGLPVFLYEFCKMLHTLTELEETNKGSLHLFDFPDIINFHIFTYFFVSVSSFTFFNFFKLSKFVYVVFRRLRSVTRYFCNCQNVSKIVTSQKYQFIHCR